MNILIINIHSNPFEVPGTYLSGGQNVYVTNLIKQTISLGHTVTILTRKKTLIEKIEYPKKCNVIEIKCGKNNLEKEELFSILDEFGLKAYQKIKNKKFDLIHSHYWLEGKVAIYLKSVLKIPLVHTYHSLSCFKFSATKKDDFLYSEERINIEKEILLQADCIFANSKLEKKSILSLVSEKKHSNLNKKIKVIPPLINDELFKMKRKKNNNSQFNFIFVSRPDKRKGLLETIKAITSINDDKIFLWIVGDHKKNDYQQIIKNKKSNFHFLGKKKNEDLPKLYQLADATIISSYYEPFGMVAIESMLCGTPVISTKVNGLKDLIIENYNGLFISNKQNSDFAINIKNSILQFINKSPEQKMEFRKNARIFAKKNFSTTKTVKKIINNYQTLTKKMKIYIIRHGLTEENRKHIYPYFNSVLNKKGKQQSLKLAKFLEKFKFEKIYSSPMTRALQTAEYISKKTKTKIVIIDSLQERKYKINISGKSAINKNLNPYEENAEHLFERSTKFLNEIIKKKEKIIVVVTHSELIRMILISILSLSKKQKINHVLEYKKLSKLKIENTAISEVEYINGNWSIISVGNISHLNTL